MTDSLTPAALGLKIGLLLCLFVGCDQPAPVADEPTPATEADFAAAKFEIVTQRLDKLEADQPESEQRFKSIEACATGVRDDIARLESRIKKLEDKPDCCMMPASQPAANVVDKSRNTRPVPIANLIDNAEQRSIDDGEKMIFLLTKDGCSRCEAFRSHVITRPFFASIDGNMHYQEVNTSHHPEAAHRFDIPDGTLLPVALLWNPADQTFHQIKADPSQNLGDFLSELNLPQQEAAPPRRHLLNL
jgi:hypothetical protein